MMLLTVENSLNEFRDQAWMLAEKAGWSPEDFEDDDKRSALCDVVNEWLLKNSKGEFEAITAQNQAIMERAFKILGLHNMALSAIDHQLENDEISPMAALLSVEAVSMNMWKKLQEEVGDEGFCYVVDGILEDGIINEDKHSQIMCFVYGDDWAG